MIQQDGFIRTTCSTCNKKLKLPVAAVGKKLKCPKCGGSFTIPKDITDLPEKPLPGWAQDSLFDQANNTIQSQASVQASITAQISESAHQLAKRGQADLQKATNGNPLRQRIDDEVTVAIPLSGAPTSPPAPVADRWWYMSEGTAKSVSFDALKNLAKNGSLEPACMVHQEGMDRWLPASQFRALWVDPPPIPVATIGSPQSVPVSVPAPLQTVSVVPVAEPALHTLPVAAQPPVPATDPQEEILEVVAVGASPSPASLIAEVNATYRGGHPDFPEIASGALRLDSIGLRFVPGDKSKNHMRIAYEKIGSILEPQLGQFPEQMAKRADRQKTGAKIAGFAAGFLGAASGHQTLGNMGKSVAGSVQVNAALGPPPSNRIRVIMLDQGVRHKLLFDVDGQSKEELEEQAHAFWSNSAKVRSQFGKPSAPAAGLETTQVSALKQLKELLDLGVLTQAEFDQQKAALLGQKVQFASITELKPQIVGCPRCQGKLRAKKPGIIQCPRCQTKMRVDRSRFK